MTIHKNTKLIPLTQGKFAIVDAEDYDWLMQWKWHYSCGRAMRKSYENGKHSPIMIHMHRLVINAPINKCVDHINSNPLDNRKCNLRLCTQSENLCNQRKTRGNSQYKGVWFDKERHKWQVYINKYGKRKNLGRFDTEAQAALAYNQAAKRLHREFAKCNLI